MGTKITARAEQEFRLQAVPEDDTIFLSFSGLKYVYLRDISSRLSVGSTEAVFVCFILLPCLLNQTS